ncbi:MAG TPA: hypothetical protein VKR58_01720, partial [Aquella sp.]|nr:hypothetical protein [Aquella sp.]
MKPAESNVRYVSNVVAVDKTPTSPLSEKQWRICGDFRAVNDNLRKSFYNTPRPIDLLEKMKGNKVFSLIDI